MIQEINKILENSGLQISLKDFLNLYSSNSEIRRVFEFDNISDISKFEDFLKTQNSVLVKFLKTDNDNLIPESKRRLNILYSITHLYQIF